MVLHIQLGLNERLNAQVHNDHVVYPVNAVRITNTEEILVTPSIIFIQHHAPQPHSGRSRVHDVAPQGTELVVYKLLLVGVGQKPANYKRSVGVELGDKCNAAFTVLFACDLDAVANSAGIALHQRRVGHSYVGHSNVSRSGIGCANVGCGASTVVVLNTTTLALMALVALLLVPMVVDMTASTVTVVARMVVDMTALSTVVLITMLLVSVSLVVETLAATALATTALVATSLVATSFITAGRSNSVGQDSSDCNVGVDIGNVVDHGARD